MIRAMISEKTIEALRADIAREPDPHVRDARRLQMERIFRILRPETKAEGEACPA
jgi:hypothetical protein